MGNKIFAVLKRDFVSVNFFQVSLFMTSIGIVGKLVNFKNIQIINGKMYNLPSLLFFLGGGRLRT